jgi:hypothetical protein
VSAIVIPFRKRDSRNRKHVTRLLVPHPKPTAGSILDYIERCRLYAERTRNRGAAAHYAELWQLVFEVTHGPLRGDPPPLQAPRPLADPGPQPVPGWKQRLLARPVRKVVSVATVLKRERGRKCSFTYTVLTLECGHTVEELACLHEGQANKRRRCRECAEHEADS